MPDGPAASPPSGVARLAAVAIGAVAIADVADVVQQIHALSLVDALRLVPGSVSDETLAAADSASATLGAVTLALIAAAGAAFITWLYRSVVFTEETVHGRLRHTRGWAIGSWFVPFLNFVRPVQIVVDVWRAAASRSERGLGVVYSWWLLLLLSTVTNRVASTIGSRAVSLDEVHTSTVLTLASDVFDIAAAGGAIAVLFRLDRLMRSAVRVTGDTPA